MVAIKTDKLTKKYKDLVAVDNLDFQVESGSLVSLLGVNGAGKTTTIKMLCGLTLPTSGDAFLNGFSVKNEPEKVKSIIAVSPQETAVAANLSVQENLMLMAGVHGFAMDKAKQKVALLMEKFDLSGIKNKRAGKLSGGWQRRLSIAMALISEPQILFLDEPTLGLDVIARRELWKIIAELKGKITIILTTHYLEEAEHLSDKIAVMKNGKLKAYDTAECLIKLSGADNFEDAFIKLAGGSAGEVI